MLLNTTFFKLHKIPLLLVLSSVLFYFSFSYDLVRTDYTKLIMLYVALFFMFYKLIQLTKHNIKFLTWMAFGFRAVFILAIPNLSQDFYRFIWDGRMILEGINPYLFTVESFISNGEHPVAQAQELYTGMGELNASHYTNYPPINQLCFVIAGLFAGKSILGSAIIMRLLIIAADFGTLYFGKKLLVKLKLPAYNIFWYILNPFIIIELTGNLHFEGVMIFFLIWSLYLLHSGKWKWAAVVFALSVSVKLIPLMFLPLLFQKLGWKRSISFYSIVGVITILLFLPFYSLEFINNYAQTVALWFQNFEFNASLYYIAREIGYLFRGYNEIVIIGKIIPVIVILFILIFTFFRKNKTTIELITAMLFVLSFYLFTSTTVHPWYVATLLILSVFTNYKFPLVWSFVIIISYLAYANADNTENLWIIGFEYLVVYGVFIWEVFFKKNSYKYN
jgi:alpha-1,6-mannosyltransferase